jgi:hypothetical protein
MACEKYNLRITSASPLTVRAVSQVNGEVDVAEMDVSELRLYVERHDGVYHFKEIKAVMES